ncbi:MAG: AAA family ATPase, partial [Flavobacterium sp.]
MKIIACNKPKHANFNFSSDVPLTKQMKNIPLYNECLNRFCTSLFVGRQGQGKSSLVMNILQDKEGLYQVYDRIFVFLPATSLSNIKGSPYEKLPNEQIYDELNMDNLLHVYGEIDKIASENADIEDAEDKQRCLIIFDDVSSEFKNTELQRVFKRIIKNQRHLFCSTIFIMQSYTDMPKQLRMICNNLFLFKMAKEVMHDIFHELVEVPKKDYDELLTTVYNNDHDWMAINMNTKQIY